MLKRFGLGKEVGLDKHFTRWTWMRAVLHRGWWLVASIYLVINADLSASQLVLIGVAQGIIALIFEVPAGVMADTISRKWSIIVSHLLMGTAMIATAFTKDFGLLVATQMLWGISWTFSSGADVAWVTDELNEPGLSSAVLVRSGKAQLTGTAAGLISIGSLAAFTSNRVAMITAGIAMIVLGVYVYAHFHETQFVPTKTKRWSASWSIFTRGLGLVRKSRAILVIFLATILVNGGEQVGRLYQRRLVDIGLTADPVIWFTVLSILSVLVGAVAFRVVEKHIEGTRTALRGYIFASAVGAVGLFVLGIAPEKITASIAILFVSGIATPLTNTISAIWVNRETGNDIRATVHSFLAQAEYLGEILLGTVIAITAIYADISLAILAGALLFAITVWLIWRYGSAKSQSNFST
jgi:predicted MFS family arabinose efflux permease